MNKIISVISSAHSDYVCHNWRFRFVRLIHPKCDKNISNKKGNKRETFYFVLFSHQASLPIFGVGKVKTNPDFHILGIENSAYIAESITPFNPEIRETSILKIFSWFEGILGYYFSVICVKPTWGRRSFIEFNSTSIKYVFRTNIWFEQLGSPNSKLLAITSLLWQAFSSKFP